MLKSQLKTITEFFNAFVQSCKNIVAYVLYHFVNDLYLLQFV